MTDLAPAPQQDESTEPASAARSGPSRRQVLIAGGVVAAAAVTAACSSSSSSSGSAAGGGSSAPAGATVQTADVPVGGGKILTEQRVVVTQPQAGDYKAFSAVCTHQGCTVASVENDTITCLCHGSQYSAADGSVKRGPATAALASMPVAVSGTTITVG